MLEFVHLIRFIVLKIFLSTIRPRTYFLYDIDILKYVCDFFYDFIGYLLFFKNPFMHVTFPYLIWTL